MRRKVTYKEVQTLTVKNFVDKTYIPEYLKKLFAKHPDSMKVLQKEMQNWVYQWAREIGIRKLKKLIKTAVEIRKTADSPYSKYKVGAAILCKSGKIYAGCNNEKASYTGTAHAEGSAIISAVVQGEAQKTRDFIKAVVISIPASSGPCGLCRQDIREYCCNALIANVDEHGKLRAVTFLDILLPYSFGPQHLGLD